MKGHSKLHTAEININSTPNESPPAVSVLIRTNNEEKHIGQILDALFSQTYKSFEVIIVDSGSTDRTLVIARKYPVNIYEIRPEDFSFGYSLNYGFQRARGKYVICLSAHTLPLSNNWISTVISNFDDEKVAAVMTKTIPWPDCNPFDRRGLSKKFDLSKQEIYEGPLSNYVYANSNAAMRKSLWKKIHFDETLSASEDHDWVKKVRQKGYKVIFEPEAEVYHSHNETLKQLYVRYSREAYADIVLNMGKKSLAELLFDFTAGTIYDMAYVIYSLDNLKWFFFAPLRRFIMNFARFHAYRKAEKKRIVKEIKL